MHIPFDVPLLPAKMLHAGPVKCLYEHGNLRYIQLQDKLVLMMIYTAVRDKDWNTIPYLIEKEKIEETESGVDIRYTAVYQQENIRYKADVNIEMRENRITFTMEGKALSTFHKNRIGICVLHPVAESVGRQALVKQPDGKEYTGSFPVNISPCQPFKDIQQISWTTIDEVRMQLEFSGDIFEMEDQRNWSDNSYKTYSTRLADPFPVLVNAGDCIRQQVIVNLFHNDGATSVADIPKTVKKPFPRIGYARVKNNQLKKKEMSLLCALPFDHYRVELDLSGSDWMNEWNDALDEILSTKLKLELIVFFSSAFRKELEEFENTIAHAAGRLDSILVLHKEKVVTDSETMTAVYASLKNKFPFVKVGYGTDQNFAELNRNLPGEISYDFLSFSLNPQVHAVDTRTLIENLESQHYTLDTLRAHVGEKEIHVSPVVLTMRTDADHIDERQHTWFAAYWMLSALYNLSPAAVTLFTTMGNNGILHRRESSPAYKVLAAIALIKPVNIYMDGKCIVVEGATGKTIQFVPDERYSSYKIP